jgi:predicted DNA-binding protein
VGDKLRGGLVPKAIELVLSPSAGSMRARDIGDVGLDISLVPLRPLKRSRASLMDITVSSTTASINAVVMARCTHTVVGARSIVRSSGATASCTYRRRWCAAPENCCAKCEQHSFSYARARISALGRSRRDGGRAEGAHSMCGRVRRLAAGYDRVILRRMKTAISLPDETFRRVDRAAKRLGVSRSEFFARAAESWLGALEDDGTTEAINHAIAGLPVDHGFAAAAAAALAAGDQS